MEQEGELTHERAAIVEHRHPIGFADRNQPCGDRVGQSSVGASSKSRADTGPVGSADLRAAADPDEPRAVVVVEDEQLAVAVELVVPWRRLVSC
jgi:hypothetical protein